MKNLEFVKKNGYFYDFKKQDYQLIKLYQYQKELLNDFDTNNYIMVNSSRQMGISTMLIFHLSNWIVNNNTDKKIFYVVSNKQHNSIEIINKLKVLLSRIELTYEVNNMNQIKLKNGNSVKIIGTQSLNHLELDERHRKQDLYGLIIDNAAYFDMSKVYQEIVRLIPKQLILTSGLRNEHNYFYDELFLKENVFKKITILWNQNPNFTKEWYDEMKNNIGEYIYEIDLIRKTKINKNRIITIRLDDDIVNKISSKLIDNDLSLSNYIRNLIEKDL